LPSGTTGHHQRRGWLPETQPGHARSPRSGGQQGNHTQCGILLSPCDGKKLGITRRAGAADEETWTTRKQDIWRTVGHARNVLPESVVVSDWQRFSPGGFQIRLVQEFGKTVPATELAVGMPPENTAQRQGIAGRPEDKPPPEAG
jgi:hypothetical protein